MRLHCFTKILAQGVWFAALVEGFSEGHIYSEEDRAQFRKNPDKLVDHVKYLDGQLNAGWPAFIKDSEAQTLARMGIQHEMAKLIKDKRLLQGSSTLTYISFSTSSEATVEGRTEAT